MERHSRKTGTALLALCLTLALLWGQALPTVAAVTQADIDALKTDAAGLKSQRSELEKKLKELADDKSAVIEKKALLDRQIENTSAQIANMEDQIVKYDALIEQKEAELADAQQREEAQYALFCKRVRAMEKRETVSYWSVLFKAESFTDLLSTLNFINEVVASDKKVMADLQTLQAELAEAKASLESSRADSQAAKDELEARKRELDQQRKEANDLIVQLENAEEENQDILDQLDREEEDILARIQQLSRELAAQQAAQGKSHQSNPGGYIWPVDSRYITSTVGGRTSPGGIGSTNHKGTDIGRVGYTSPIYAAKAGTVIVSALSSSYGNYVVISHGSGNTTLYAHMSQRKATVGQYVEQGDVIGITGSTGNSTGPHLHFEVVEGGVRVNPLNDGAAPKKGYLTGYTLSRSA